jgi:hypothetical protein
MPDRPATKREIAEAERRAPVEAQQIEVIQRKLNCSLRAAMAEWAQRLPESARGR